MLVSAALKKRRIAARAPSHSIAPSPCHQRPQRIDIDRLGKCEFVAPGWPQRVFRTLIYRKSIPCSQTRLSLVFFHAAGPARQHDMLQCVAHHVTVAKQVREGTMVVVRTEMLNRKLSAILYADVHGFSRLMEHDEPGTVLRLTRSLTLIRNLAVDYGGSVVNTAGDGLVALFPSAARRCISRSKCSANCQTKRSGPGRPGAHRLSDRDYDRRHDRR